MDAGVIDLVCSRSLPEGTAQLIQLLRDSINTGIFLPFTRLIYTQDGTALDCCNHSITPEEIITMDWLTSNVSGTLPSFQQLLSEAQALVRIQGVQKI